MALTQLKRYDEVLRIVDAVPRMPVEAELDQSHSATELEARSDPSMKIVTGIAETALQTKVGILECLSRMDDAYAAARQLTASVRSRRAPPLRRGSGAADDVA